MNYWIYKCNSRMTDYAPVTGDWRRELFEPNVSAWWGSTTLKGVDQIRPGDLLLAYQSDRNELVGTARVDDRSKTGGVEHLYITPVELIGVKVRPLKKADPKIRAIRALQGGDIRTAYPITTTEAKRLLAAARKSAVTRARGKPLTSKKKKKLTTIFTELPMAERKEYERQMKIVARTAGLRDRVLRLWPRVCAACGLRMEDTDGNSECEVAHVRDVHARGIDLVANAIPLCRTHHWAFDRHLWGIHPKTLKISVKPKTSASLQKLKGKEIKRPKPAGDVKPLAAEYLQWRWKEFKGK